MLDMTHPSEELVTRFAGCTAPGMLTLTRGEAETLHRAVVLVLAHVTVAQAPLYARSLGVLNFALTMSDDAVPVNVNTLTILLDAVNIGIERRMFGAQLLRTVVAVKRSVLAQRAPIAFSLKQKRFAEAESTQQTVDAMTTHVITHTPPLTSRWRHIGDWCTGVLIIVLVVWAVAIIACKMAGEVPGWLVLAR